MNLGPEHIQPLSFAQLLRTSWQKGKVVFFQQLPGNFLFLLLLTAPVLYLYDYIEMQFGADPSLHILSILLNALIISIGGAHVLYLLIGNQDSTYGHRAKTAFLKTLKIIPFLITGTILYAILVFVGSALLILPGLLIFAYLAFYTQAIAFENLTVMKAVSRSRELVKGSFWKIFGIMIAILLVSNFILIIFHYVVYMLTPMTFVIEVLVNTFTFLFMMPFIGALYTFLYFDLRSRQEAFDFQSYKREQMRLGMEQ